VKLLLAILVIVVVVVLVGKLIPTKGASS